MLADLEWKKRDLQLRKHLESYKIARAKMESIGEGRKLSLRSFGIETAWDIDSRSVLAVRLWPMLTSKLMHWRKSVEQLFTFNPNTPTDPADIAKVRSEISMRRNAMETELLRGVRDLETLRAEPWPNAKMSGSTRQLIWPLSRQS